MRFPLTRFNADVKDIAWWEWLFAPILLPLFVILLIGAAALSVPIEFVRQLLMQRHERRLPRQLAAVGRYLAWSELEGKLQLGEGTLIVAHLSPTGPIREWWTEDNLVSSAPVTLPRSLQSAIDIVAALQQYAQTCAEKYVALEGGKAKLTHIPRSSLSKLNPAKYVVADLGDGLMSAIYLPMNGRKLHEAYPQARVVSLLKWLDTMVIAQGDMEDVLFPT